MSDMSCQACGLPMPAGARFCPHCGKSQITATEERRLVSVLFADIVGFTSLAQDLDPEQVKRLVDATFQRLGRDVQRFGGKIDKVIGDEIVALFGAPVAHDDDPERAVRAAIAMQDTVANLTTGQGSIKLRIGITTGDVLVGTTMIGGDYTAMGDTMNLASRLESMAEPGQIIVGPATRDATADAIVYRPLGAVATRGRSGKVNIYEAVRAVGAPGSRRRLARGPLVGRSHELGVLDAVARLAVENHRAQLAMLQGQAGVGKDRIAAEAAEMQHRTRGALVLEGRCAPYGEANVWWPIAEALRGALGLGGDVPVDEAEARIIRWLADHEVAADRPRITMALLHTLGYLTPLRGGDRERNRAEVVLAVSTILDARLREGPIVFVLSDADWASDAVWVLLERVLNDLAGAPLMVIVTSRDTDLPPGLRAGPFGSLTVQVQPLDPVAAREFLSHLGVNLSERNADRLIERSGGNPFFLQELVGLIVRRSAEESDLTDDELVDQLMTAEVEQLPDTLRGTIAARIDALEPRPRLLLQDAAVLGRAGPVEGLAEMARQSRGVDDIGPGLQILVDEDLLEVRDARFRFRSDLVRDVAYATITKTLRAQRHAQIADFLEQRSHPSFRNSMVAGIADHYRRSAHLVAEMGHVPGIERATITAKALHWTKEAGERALASDPPSAESWFTAALDFAVDSETRARLLYGRAQARLEIGDLGGCQDDLDHLDTLRIREPTLHARAMVVRGNLERRRRNLPTAAAMLREAADRLAALGERGDQALALRLLGLAEMARSDYDLARQALEASQGVAATIGDRRAEAWAFQSLAWLAFTAGRVDEASQFVERASALFTELNDTGGLTWTRGVEAWVLFHEGRLAAAERLVADVLPETQRRGDPWAEGVTEVLSASIHLWSGRPAEALVAVHSALAAATRADDVNLAVQARAIQGRAQVSLGNVTDGIQSLEQAFSLAEHQGDADSQRLAAAASCAAAARLGNSAQVIQWAARFDSVHPHAHVLGETEVAVSLGLALLQQGRVDDARQELAWVESCDAVAAMVAVAAGDHEEARRRIDAVLAAEPTYLDAFRARLALMAVEFRDGEIERAREVLDIALAEIGRTGDRVSRPLASLFSGVCGFEPLADAKSRCRALGIEPSGWITAARAMIGSELVGEQSLNDGVADR